VSGQPQKTSRDHGGEPLRLGAPPRHPAVRTSAPPARTAESAIPLEVLIPKATGRGAAPPSKLVSDALLKIADEDSRVAEADSVRDTAPELARAVRRDESVIAEAVRLRRSRGAQALDTGRALFARLVAAPKAILDAAFSWPSKLQRLPPAERNLVIVAPFVMAATLALGLVALERRPDTVEAAVAPAPTAATVIVGGRRAEAGAPTAQLAAVAAVPTAPIGAAPNVVPEAIDASRAAPATAMNALAPASVATSAPPEATATAATLAGVRRRVEQRATIVAAAKRSAQRVLAVDVGVELTTYPAFPAGEGWVLARADGGETGYVRLGAFDPRPAAPPVAATGERAPSRRAVRAEARPLPVSRGLDAPLAKRRPRAEHAKRDAKRKRAPKAAGELTAEDLLLGR
jgi:hypothetical protein